MEPSEAMQTDENPQLVRRGVLVRGVVQGVGFRPFVYRLAMEERLSGFVGNDTDGVTLEIEGSAVRVDVFLTRLRAEAPPLARIDSVTVRELGAKGGAEFHIVASEVLGRVSTGIPADAATCADCLREMMDEQDRRFGYPFLNCTNCGPRFTITRSIPYDRPQTSMAEFTMCAVCQAEYDDPLNRRFHAQPNACCRGSLSAQLANERCERSLVAFQMNIDTILFIQYPSREMVLPRQSKYEWTKANPLDHPAHPYGVGRSHSPLTTQPCPCQPICVTLPSSTRTGTVRW